MNNKELRDKVYNFKTKYEEGFTDNDVKELLKEYPDVSMKHFNDAMMGNTCLLKNNSEVVMYHCDILAALKCGLEKRQLYTHEWD